MREYFKRGKLAKIEAMSRERKPRPKHAGVKYLVRLSSGVTRIMSSAQLASHRGRIRGGVTAHQKGNAPVLTSESGREVATRFWKRVKRSKRTGRSMRHTLCRRRALDRKALRYLYTRVSRNGVRYDGQAWVIEDDLGRREVSERTALKWLGHLPGREQMPLEVVKQL